MQSNSSLAQPPRVSDSVWCHVHPPRAKEAGRQMSMCTVTSESGKLAAMPCPGTAVQASRGTLEGDGGGGCGIQARSPANRPNRGASSLGAWPMAWLDMWPMAWLDMWPMACLDMLQPPPQVWTGPCAGGAPPARSTRCPQRMAHPTPLFLSRCIAAGASRRRLAPPAPHIGSAAVGAEHDAHEYSEGAG